jgi:hypothetical protein
LPNLTVIVHPALALNVIRPRSWDSSGSRREFFLEVRGYYVNRSVEEDEGAEAT